MDTALNNWFYLPLVEQSGLTSRSQKIPFNPNCSTTNTIICSSNTKRLFYYCYVPARVISFLDGLYFSLAYK